MPRVVLFDLFNTLVPGGADEERAAVARAMGVDLGVDPDTYASLFYQSYRERYVGALGDLEATVRTIAEHAGGRPTGSAVRLASARRIAFTRRLLWPSARHSPCSTYFRARVGGSGW
jgi:putative hydrolase of the HAD superfamily